MATKVIRPMDSEWPSIMEHFDQQFTTAQADMRVIRAAQEAMVQQINAVNARLDTVVHENAYMKERQAEVLTEVRRTNGRVNTLERESYEQAAELRVQKATREAEQKTAGGSLNIAFSLVMAAVAMGSLIVAIIATQ